MFELNNMADRLADIRTRVTLQEHGLINVRYRRISLIECKNIENYSDVKILTAIGNIWHRVFKFNFSLKSR